MSTIFHQGRIEIRQIIGSRTLAEVADFLFPMIEHSRYQENGQKFFLLPHMQFLADKVGLSVRQCRRVFKELVNQHYIQKVKVRCHDGAVRLKVFFTDKFLNLMHRINNITVNQQQTKREPLKNIESDILSPSYIKEEIIKDNDHNDCSFMKKDEKKLSEQDIDVENLETLDDYIVDHDNQTLLTLPQINRKFRYRDVCRYACQCFCVDMVPYSQRLALAVMVDFIERKGRVINKHQVYQWLVYMLLHKHRFFSYADDFKHWSNMLLKRLKDNTLTKPKGFDRWLLTM